MIADVGGSSGGLIEEAKSDILERIDNIEEKLEQMHGRSGITIYPYKLEDADLRGENLTLARTDNLNGPYQFRLNYSKSNIYDGIYSVTDAGKLPTKCNWIIIPSNELYLNLYLTPTSVTKISFSLYLADT